MKEETKNERLILEAAEDEFLKKGYAGAKTTAIAKRAGVTHAMLHYYYRTKENLFQKVFEQKVRLIAGSFETVLDEDLPFEEIIRSFIEKHFDFVMANPELINFVYNEVKANNGNIVLLRNILQSKVNTVLTRFEKIIEREVQAGSIRPVKPLELLINIITLNLSVSLAFAVLGNVLLNKQLSEENDLLSKKREENIQYILYSLKV